MSELPLRSTIHPTSLAAALVAVPLALGAAVGVLSAHEELGTIARLGVPWVAAAFVVGATSAHQTRPWPTWATLLAAAVGAIACLRLANEIYYGAAGWEVDPGWGTIGIWVGLVFGLAGATWVRTPTSRGAIVGVAALGAVIAGEPLGWQLSHTDRNLPVAGIVVLAAAGSAVPVVLLPRALRVRGLIVTIGLASLVAGAVAAIG